MLALSPLAQAKPGKKAAAEPAVATSDDALEQADALWEERGDEAKLTEALSKYAEVIAAGPNRHALIRLTRGWYFYGDAFTTDKAVKGDKVTFALPEKARRQDKVFLLQPISSSFRL